MIIEKKISETLKVAQMNVVDETETVGYCSKAFICAEAELTKQTDGKGDSGGPLFYYNTLEDCMHTTLFNRPIIIGVLSHHLGKLSVFTRVAHYLEWIESYVKISSPFFNKKNIINPIKSNY